MLRKFSLVTSLSLVLALGTATPAFAIFDVGAHIGDDINCSPSYLYVRGKSYAYSDHPNLDYVNVYGQFYSGSTLLESGVDSAGANVSAEVLTASCTYSSAGSYYEYAAAREYYTDGSYSSQIVDDYSW